MDAGIEGGELPDKKLKGAVIGSLRQPRITAYGWKIAGRSTCAPATLLNTTQDERTIVRSIPMCVALSI